MNRARDQAVDLVELQHHGAQHHVVLELILGGQRVNLATAPFDHGRDVAGPYRFRVDDLQPFRQLDAAVSRHLLDLLATSQQHAARDPSPLADGGGFHGARFAAFGQDDASVRLLGELDQLVTEGRGRERRRSRGSGGP
jgi:hypothetical protein